MTVYVFYAIFFSWLVVLTWVLVKSKDHYQRLVTRTGKTTIDEILDVLLKENEKNRSEIRLIQKQIKDLQDKGKTYYQKIGLVRFNPFDRIGGEQSFVMSLLDDNRNGITINFIHTRDGLRVYTKKIKNGTGEGYELSDEEKKAIEKGN